MRALAKTSETSSAHHHVGGPKPSPLLFSAQTSESHPSLAKGACACGGGCPRCATHSGGVLRRKCACDGTGKNCDDCDDKKVRRKSDGASAFEEVPHIVHEVLASPGVPLEMFTRRFMESRLGHDFSRVRVHTDPRASDSARAVSASAYTVGKDIVFARGQYQPASSDGRKLLAHELAHVMQNSDGGSSRGGLTLGAVNAVEERQADAIADRVDRPSRNLPHQHVGPAQNTLRRQMAGSSFVCGDSEQGLISNAADPAKRYVDEAQRRVGEFVDPPKKSEEKDTNPDAQKKVATALSKHFSVSGPNAVTVAKQIYSTLGTMSEKLGEIQTTDNVRKKVNCHSASEAVCQIADAYIDRSAVIPQFNVCAGFSKGATDDLDRQAEILIHESAHAANIQITDRAYLSQRFYRMLDTPAALANAESYSAFVMQLLFKGSRGEISAPVDILVECPDQTLKKTMAIAEHWNWAALSAFVDPNFMELFGHILWNWGLADRSGNGFTPKGEILQTLADNYKAAQDKFFSYNRTVRCTDSEEVCKARHGVMLKNDQLQVCTSGPTAEPPSGCPGCILGLLYKGLGGQLVTKAVAIATDIADITDAPRRSAKMNTNLDAADRKRPEVKRGDRGCPIPELQEKLMEANGKRFKVTGKFDADTEAAVIAFQTAGNLLASGARRGEADEKTWAALHLKVPGEHGLPFGEKFIQGESGGWGKVGDKTQYDWYQVLEPSYTDFSGCWVKEMSPEGGIDPHENTCCVIPPCPGGITGGAWQVDDKNTYGPDTVGISRDVVDGLRPRRRFPCSYLAPQAMVILRDPRVMAGVNPRDRAEVLAKSKDAESAEYVRNELLYKVTETDIRCGKRNKYGLNTSKIDYP